MLKKPDISIIIVHYGPSKELFECLKSIRDIREKEKTIEIILVDNNEDKKGESVVIRKFPWVKYVPAPRNLGFGGGCNFGRKEAQGNLLLFLNSDIKITYESFKKLKKFIRKNKRIGLVSAKLINISGTYSRQATRDLTPLRAIFFLSFLNKIIPENKFTKRYLITDWDRDTTRKVEVAQLGGFIVRSEAFDSISGFDEKMFLYFEENDLAKRLRGKGWNLYYYPEAEVIHLESKGTPKKTVEIKKVFSQSRFHYFKKHYGFIWATLVEGFARFSKWSAALLVVLILAALLLFWRLNELMMFIGDFAWIYLSARDMLLTGEIPLVGIASSVPVFKQGALFTWMLGASLWLSKFNPVSGAVMTVIIGLFAVWFTYYLISKWFGKQVGIIAALLAATSPLLVIHSRMPFETAPIFFATLLIAWSTYQIVRKKKYHYFFLGLWLALLYQLELAGFILLPVVLLSLLWQKIKVSRKDIFGFIYGGLLGLTPFIIWDLKQGVYLQTLGFTAWVFTKIWEGIAGFAAGGFNAASYSAGLDYLVRFIYPSSPYFAQALALFSLAIFLIYVFQHMRKLAFEYKFIFLWLTFALSGFILRGIVSEAYTPLLFFPLVVILSLSFRWLLAKTSIYFWLIIITIVSVNSIYLIQTNYLLPSVYGLPYSERLKISDSIIENADGREYKFIYQGPGDNFAASDDNYQYLLWWMGNKPVKSSPLSYTLFEPADKLTGNFDEVIDFGHTKVGTNYD